MQSVRRPGSDIRVLMAAEQPPPSHGSLVAANWLIAASGAVVRHVGLHVVVDQRSPGGSGCNTSSLVNQASNWWPGATDSHREGVAVGGLVMEWSWGVGGGRCSDAINSTVEVWMWTTIEC